MNEINKAEQSKRNDITENKIHDIVKAKLQKYALIFGIGNIITLVVLAFTVINSAEEIAESVQENAINKACERMEDKAKNHIDVAIATASTKFDISSKLVDNLIDNYAKSMMEVGSAQKDLKELRDEINTLNKTGVSEAANFLEKFKNFSKNKQAELDSILSLKKLIPKIFHTSIVVNSYYDFEGKINEEGEVSVEFPKGYFSKPPRVMLSIRGWSYYGNLSVEPEKLKQGMDKRYPFLQMDRSWAKVSKVTKENCQIQIYLHEVVFPIHPKDLKLVQVEQKDQFDNQFLLDVLAFTN